MKAHLPMDVTVALAGLALGFFAAVRVNPAGMGLAAGGLRSVLADSPAGGHAEAGKGTGSGDGNSPHSLAAFEQRLGNRAAGPDYSSHMERLGTEELKALGTSLFRMSMAEPETQRSAFLAIHDAARELYRREGLVGIEWARGLSPEDGRMPFFQQMLFAAVEDSPAAAKPWVDLFQKEDGPSRSNPFLSAAVRAASTRGVDAILEVAGVFGNEMGTTPLLVGQVPGNFEFKRLLDKMGEEFGMHQPMHLWAANDPEAVWQAVKDGTTGGGKMSARRFGSLFSGMSQTKGEEAATKWLVSRLDELPQGVREEAVFSMLATHEFRYQVVDTVMAGLPRESDRILIATNLITPFAGDAPLKILRDLGSASARTEALVGSAKVFSRAANDPANPLSKQMNEFFNKAVEDLDLSPADRERVLETLRTPQDLFPK